MAKKVDKDLNKVRKGAKVKMKDGREGTVRGMYLSATGPAFMIHTRAGQITADNVSAEDVEGVIVEE